MKPRKLGAGISVIAILGLAIALGHTLGVGRKHDPGAAEKDHAAHQHGDGGMGGEMEPKLSRQKKKILYYRNPMGLPDTSPVPKKDSMGMDYIPVYEEAVDGPPGTLKISLDRVQKSGVRVAKAELRALTRQLHVPGKAMVDERTLSVVTLRADAFIERLHVNETGMHVNKGDTLFRIYSPQMVSAQVDYFVANRDRNKETRQGSLRGAEQKLRNLSVPKAAIDEMKRTGEPVLSIDWPSPVAGFVLAKGAVEGQKVVAGDELFRIADLASIWVIADVSERDIGLVKVGSRATMRFRAFQDRTFEGKVTFLQHELDPVSRTGKIRIEITNPGLLIRHRMYADVEILLHDDALQRLVVPASSIIDSGRRKIVLVERGEGRFEPRPVTLGLKGESDVEIKEGLKAGEKVVVSANFLIDAESNIQAALRSFVPAQGQPSVTAPAEGAQ
jgi:membrane fusion protein, copper/silver efflux system